MSCWVGFVKRHTYKTKENKKSFFISFSSCEIQTGNQCQEAIPTGSGAPSSQEDNSQARADWGAEAGDQGGLWAVWHRWLWTHRCEGAQGKRSSEHEYKSKNVFQDHSSACFWFCARLQWELWGSNQRRRRSRRWLQKWIRMGRERSPSLTFWQSWHRKWYSSTQCGLQCLAAAFIHLLHILVTL